MIKPLNRVSRADIALVGGKAASLGEMLQAGIQVPPGFVITTTAFRRGMSKSVEQIVLKAFDELGFERVAVRSSAVAEDSSTASWAGQLDTFLNVSRNGIIQAVQDCWQSINSAHAQSYANENKVSQDQRVVAVVVQTMVDSEVAGVMFTANPVSGNREECVIEAVYGLGELLVQGTVTPESFVVTKQSGKILEHQLHSQQKMLVYRDGKNQEVALDSSRMDQPILTDKQLSDLLTAARRIEAHYKFPQDIEWAIAKKELYIVQSRPITTLDNPPADTKLISKIRQQDWEFYVSRKFNWFIEDTQIKVMKPKLQQKCLGFHIPIDNYLILNGDEYGSPNDYQSQQTVWATKLAEDEDFFDKFASAILNIASDTKTYTKSLENTNHKNKTNTQLAKDMIHFVEKYEVSFMPAFMRPDTFLEHKVTNLFKTELGFAQVPQAMQTISYSVQKEGLAYTEEPVALLEIARLVQQNQPSQLAIDNLLQKHQTKYGWLKEPTSSNTQVFSILSYQQRLKHLIQKDCEAVLKDILKTRAQDQAALARLLANKKLSGQTKKIINALHTFIYLRTLTSEVTDHLFYVAKNTLLEEISQRLQMELNQLLMYTADEILDLLDGGEPNPVLIKDRSQAFAIVWQEGKCTTLFGDEAAQLTHDVDISNQPKLHPQATIIKGSIASGGLVKGTAKILRAYNDVDKVKPGDIIVATMTTPEYVSAMEKAAAFVTDEGGMTCHAAILAREFNIPCIVGTVNATRIIKDGDLVEVDANNGIVKITAKNNAKDIVPFDENVILFRWGPIRGRYFLISDYIAAACKELQNYMNTEHFPKTLLLFNKDQMVWICGQEEFNTNGKRVFSTYAENPNSLQKFIDDYQKQLKRLTALHSRLASTNLKSLNDQEFHGLWQDFYNTVISFWLPTLIPELANYGAPDLLKEQLSKCITNDEEFIKAMETLTAPDELSFYQQEELELAATHDIKAHQAKYYWLKNSYGSVQTLPVKFFQDRKKELTNSKATPYKKTIKDATRNAKQQLKEIYRLPDSIMHTAELIADNLVWQDHRKRYITENFHYKFALLQELSRRKNLPLETLLKYGFEELGDYIVNENAKEKLKDIDVSGIEFDTSVISLSQTDAQRLWDMYQVSKTQTATTIKGIVASSGKGKPVRGKVRVLRSSHAVLESGEVLVAAMTSPGYVFAMRNAVAVITDIGGLTSHAAIVSRELGVPCIVGTKNATSVLNDGDEVQVDPVSGIVEVITSRVQPQNDIESSKEVTS